MNAITQFRSNAVRPLAAASVLVVVSLAGCAGLRPRAVGPAAVPAAATFSADNPQFERGKPYRLIDGLGWIVGVPEKVLLWDRRAVNHNVSQETEQSLAEYVARNGMNSTKVRINQYDPGGEWRRLVDNKRVGAGWRYTIGAISVLGYTLIPGRVFASDYYNPYTDTINVYSDIPALALEQGGHAKNIQSRDRPGTYGTFMSLPLLTLFPERIAKNEVLAYEQAHGSLEEQMAAAEALYPQYGTEIGMQGQYFGPGGALLALPGAAIGHLAGRRHSQTLRQQFEAGSMSQAIQQAAYEAPTETVVK